jgi:hypothetical protein
MSATWFEAFGDEDGEQTPRSSKNRFFQNVLRFGLNISKNKADDKETVKTRPQSNKHTQTITLTHYRMNPRACCG